MVSTEDAPGFDEDEYEYAHVVIMLPDGRGAEGTVRVPKPPRIPDGTNVVRDWAQKHNVRFS